MKILRVGLENLNSLRGSHAVDFSVDPIAGAGIFAITGATGAGKSTLLDAITLALYGRAARYGGGGVPEDMMSRHTGECRAEVEFEVAGGRFRAVWQLRRSKGKADGKMQHPKRYLYDADGVVLAEKKGDFESQVEALSGLNYERFMRSVLLAQGEFAKFLKAKPGERAGLLESLTGTGVYSELGKLAYEEVGRREGELALQEGALGQLEVLEPTERAALEKEEEQVREELAKVRARRARYEKEVQNGVRLREHMEAMDGVKMAQAKLKARRDGAAEKLVRLAKHRVVVPMIPLLDRLDEAEDTEVRLKCERDEAEKSAVDAGLQWRAGVRWAREYARCELEKAQGELDLRRGEIAKVDGNRREIEVWLKAHDGDADLGEALVGINRLGSDWEHVRESRRKARAKLLAVEEEKVGAVKRHVETKEKWEKAKGVSGRARGDFEKKRDFVAEVLAGRSEDEWRLELREMVQKKAVLGQLRVLDDALKQAKARLEEFRRNAGTLAVDLEKAEKGVEDAEEALKRVSELSEACRGHLDAARLVASFEEHRGDLKEGEACPLCGAMDHPFAQGGGIPGGAVRELESKVSEVGKRVEAAEAVRREARELVVRIGSEKEAVEKNSVQLLEEVKALGDKMRGLGGGFREGAEGEVERRTRELEGKVSAIRKAVEVAGVAEAIFAKAEAALERQGVEVAARGEEVEKLSASGEALNGEIAELEKGEKEAAGRLEAALRTYGMGFEKGDLGEGWRESLAGRAKKFAEMVRDREVAEKELARLRAAEKELGVAAEGWRKWRDVLAGKEAVDPAPEKAVSRSRIPMGRDEWEVELAELERAKEESRIGFEEKNRRWAEAKERATQCKVKAGEAAGGRTLEDVRAARMGGEEVEVVAVLEKELEEERQRLSGAAEAHGKSIEDLRSGGVAEGDAFARIRELRVRAENEGDKLSEKRAGISERLRADTANRRRRAELGEELEVGRKGLETWRRLRGLIGSADGSKFSRFAQGISLEVLTVHANGHLGRLSDRYVVRRMAGEDLELEIVDRYQGDTCRPMSSLSGGESFLVSLALALGLSDLAGRNVRIDSLFIDEGFGALDGETLDVAISALDSLRLEQKTVGVISHIDLLKERIATQVVVEKGSGGVGRVRVVGG